MQVLPLTSDPCRFFTTDLGDAKYTIETRYNERSESWTFDVTRDIDQVTLVTGVPLLLGQDMLAPYALGIGGLVAADMNQTDVDAGPEDLGERVIVTWLSEEELKLIKDFVTPAGATTTAPVVGPVGAGVPLVPLVDVQQHVDETGAEVTTSSFTADLTPNLAVSITMNIAFQAASAAGTATYRAYVGATLVGTVTRSGAALAPLRISGSLPNPGGIAAVTVTMQSSGAGIQASIDDLTGILG